MKYLRVVPNQFAALDAEGHPAGAYAHEGTPGLYVGARLVADGQDPDVGSMLAGAKRSGHRHFEFDGGVETVPATPHYLYALRTRELLPADKATALEAGIKWVPVEEALNEARVAAEDAYHATNGRFPTSAKHRQGHDHDDARDLADRSGNGST